MKKISLLKKIKLYNQYRKIIRNNRQILSGPTLNLRVDRVSRLYTVINLPDDVKTYGTSLTEKHIKEYITKADTKFNEMGLGEFIGILDMDKIDETNYLVVFGFSLMNTVKFWNVITFSIISVILITLGLFLF